MKTPEGNATRAERRNSARAAHTLSKWREREYVMVRKVVSKDADGAQVVRNTRVVGAPK